MSTYPAFDGTQPCRGMDTSLFFIETHALTNYERKALRNLCAGCTFQVECREYAITNHMDGWWGGMTAGERTRYAKQRNRQTPALPSTRTA